MFKQLDSDAALRGRKLFTVFLGLLVGMPAWVYAQQPLEEIVVTAQKREQSIQDVPISITAWSGDQLRSLDVQQSFGIARFTPGVDFVATSGVQDTHLTIRGVTQGDFNDSIEPPNAVYVDEGYIATVQGNRFAMYDLERVEILRGPQGTLFGRNATGGLVQYVTKKPTEEFEAYADLLLATESQTRLEAAISGPLTERLMGRIAGTYNQYDEIITNAYPAGNQINPLTMPPRDFIPSTVGQDDWYNNESWAARGHLLWDINDNADFLISAFGSGEELATNGSYEQGQTTAIGRDLDGDGVLDGNTGDVHTNTIFSANDPQGCEAIDEATGQCLAVNFVDGTFFQFVRPVQGGDLFGFTDPGGGGDQVASADHSIDDFNTYDVFGTTAKLTWDFGPTTFTSVTHFIDFEKEQSLDTDVSPIPQSHVINNNQSDTFTQELRLSGDNDTLNWVAGFYYLQYNNSNAIGLGFMTDSPITILVNSLPGNAGVGSFETDSFVDWDRTSYALFGQIDWSLTDRWTLSAGLRLIREESDYDYVQLTLPNANDAIVDADQTPLMVFAPGPPPAIGPEITYPPFSADIEDDLWAGRLAVDYRLNDQWMFYGSIDRGVKAPGFNGKLNDFTAPLAASEIPYDEEELLAYEVGFKSTLGDGRTRLGGSVYFYDYQDHQAFVFVGSSGRVQNTDAEYFGFELELSSRPVDALDLLFNVSYIDAQIDNLSVADNVFRDVEPPHTPEWQGAAIGRYTWSNVLGGDIAWQVAVTYTDSRFHNYRNFDAQNMDSYTLVDTRLSWFSAGGRWELAIFGNNVFDEEYKIGGFDLSTLCGCTEEAWGRPAWWGVQARFSTP